ncbi:glycosyltransferase family protein [Sphingomonas sp. ID0503]|uniref:glycosyltransferase family protein n=1 Tax=Sphingomonas sp. ID0503 TaxID=3399691 RepID=UPI003AFA52D8
MSEEAFLLDLRLRGTRHAVPLTAIGGKLVRSGEGWRTDGTVQLVQPPGSFSFFLYGDEDVSLRSSIGASALPPGSTYRIQLFDLSGEFVAEHDFPLKGRRASLSAPGRPLRGRVSIDLPGPAVVAPLRIAVEPEGNGEGDGRFDPFAVLPQSLHEALRVEMATDEVVPQPHPWFMPNWYRRFSQDRGARKGSPLLDYARRSSGEALTFHPLIDPERAAPGSGPALLNDLRTRAAFPNRAAAIAQRLGLAVSPPDLLPDDPDAWLKPLPRQPHSVMPDVSIVMVLSGPLADAEDAIEALLTRRSGAAIEVILVAQDVPKRDLPRLREWQRIFDAIRVVDVESGLAFAVALSAGVTEAQADLLAIVGSGTVVADDWFVALSDGLRHAMHSVPKLVEADGIPRAGAPYDCLLLRRQDFATFMSGESILGPPALSATTVQSRSAGNPAFRRAGPPSPLPLGPLRIAIKVAYRRGPLANSGDHHFAAALAAAFEQHGHQARIDHSAEWYSRSERVDVVIALCGRGRYVPRPHERNVAWVISHPDDATAEALGGYDHVFAASPRLVQRFAADGIDATLLLQCTDPARFNPGEAPTEPRLIFVANSRQVLRPVAAAAVKEALPLEIYGRGWERFEARQFLRGHSVANADLPALYRSGIVFNDHWADMAEAGILSNRLFDAAACASPIISDPVEGVDRLFGDLVERVSPGEALAPIVARLYAESSARRAERLDLARSIAAEHSFLARAQTILRTIRP